MYQYILAIFSHEAYSKVDFARVKLFDAIFFGSIPTIKYYIYLFVTLLIFQSVQVIVALLFYLFVTVFLFTLHVMVD